MSITQKSSIFLGFLYFDDEMRDFSQWPELSEEFEDRPLEGTDSEDAEDWRHTITEKPVTVPRKKAWKP